MAFADPTQCPSCHATLTQPTACSSCGFDLSSVEARQLWQTLLQADELLERARTVSSVPPSVSPPRATDLPKAPPTPPRAPKDRTLSTGGVILALGAGCLLVAGFIFITVSWGSLGVTGRALVLLAFTAIIGALARAVSQRGLRGSAEALWTVFLGMLTLDWFAAWGQNLFGFGNASFTAVALIWAAGIFGVATLTVTRVANGRTLVMPQLIAGAAPWVGATAFGFEVADGWSDFWAVVGAGVLGAGFWWASSKVGMKWAAWPSAGYTALVGVIATGMAMTEVGENPRWSDLVEQRHAIPMVAVIAIAVAMAVLVPKVRMLATAGALLGAAFLVAVPFEDQWTDRGALIVVAIASLGAALVQRPDAAGRGFRLLALVAATATALLVSPWVASAVDGVTTRWANTGHEHLLAEQSVGASQNRWWWVPLIAGVALGGVALLARRWPEASRLSRFGVPAAAAIAALGALLAASAFDGPYILLALVTVGIGFVLIRREMNQGIRIGGMGLMVAGATLASPTQSGTTVVWAVAALAFITIAKFGRSEWDVKAAALAATVLLGGVAAQVADLTEWSADVVALTLVAAGSLAIVAASTLLRPWTGRDGVEGGALIVTAIGLGVASVESSLPWIALMWTIAGAVLVVLGLTIRDRSVLRWVGSATLGVAYVLRLAASDVGVIEAYTLPFGIVLLAVGAWALRRADGPSSAVALGAGLTLTLLPSLPQALEDPTSLRALLLGLGALLAVGGGAWRRWNAPFLSGVAVVALLALVSLGPYALALPRWALIAGAGALLLGIGVTWEERVRQGRAVTRFVGDMR